MIEVGDFIRTNGIIGRVEQIGNSLFWLEDGSSYSLSDKAVKYSKNIIDLIEVSDYVNGMKIDDIGEIKRFGKTTQKCLWVNIGDGIDIIDEEIRDILTKEQYTKTVYTVERK